MSLYPTNTQLASCRFVGGATPKRDIMIVSQPAEFSDTVMYRVYLASYALSAIDGSDFTVGKFPVDLFQLLTT